MNLVSAGIIEKDDKILIAKRREGKCLEPLWEFPGGKLEENETIEECLIREIKEELDIEIEVNNFVTSCEFFCGEKKIKLMAFKAKYLSGEIKLNAHQDARWVTLNEIQNFEFVRADKKIIQNLLENNK